MIRKLLPILCLTVIAASVPCFGEGAIKVMMGQKLVDPHNVDSATLYQGFVPVKASADALGASVRYEDQSHTITISGHFRTSRIRIGSRSAFIDGASYSFPYPPYIYGNQAYAPIMLFNEQFGAILNYDDTSGLYRWQIIPQFVQPNPGIVYGPGLPSRQSSVRIPSTIVGEVIQVLPSKTGSTITVRTAGKAKEIALASDAIILRGKIGGPAAEVPLGSIRPGDRVTIKLNSSGRAESIRARYRSTTGKVTSAEGSMFRIDTGEVLKTTQETEVIVPGNSTGALEDIHVGDTVVASISPITGYVYMIKVMRDSKGGKPEESNDQITLNSAGLLKEGDTLIVSFRAQAGGVARFSLPGVKNGIPMNEVKPGLYRGMYIVQPGDMLSRQPVSVDFTAPSGEKFATTSRRTLTIETVPGYLPRIISPHQWEQISSPLVVTGIAKPLSRVRVTVEYRADTYGVLPMEGTSDVQVVTADESGHWQTSSLSAAAPFDEDQYQIPWDLDVFTREFDPGIEPTIIWSITATAIGPNGLAKSSYRVNVVKKPARVLGGL